MGNKKLGIIFLCAVLLSFLFGYLAANLFPTDPFDQISQEPILTEITEQFQTYYYYDIDDDDQRNAFIAQMEAIISSYATASNDPYTRMVGVPLNTEPTDDESFIGIGISLLFEAEGLRVIYVYPGSPAEGKLYPNDLIVGVQLDEAYLYAGKTQSEILDTLSGTIDTEKQLIVQNPDLEQSTISIVYQVIETPSVESFSLEEDTIGYIKINSFNGWIDGVTPGTNALFGSALYNLEQNLFNQNPEDKTLIIDVRNNPGGALSALYNGDSNLSPGILQLLLSKKNNESMFTMVNRYQTQTYQASLNQPKAYNIVVLVNEDSASASELLAASLKYYGEYELYGASTYGKGVYQSSLHLGDIGNMRYTLVYTQGTWNYGNGLNVSTDPLEVVPIEQKGILAIDMPVYHGEVSYNQVSSSLALYQVFLNTYYQLEGMNALRTDGYFDQATADQLSIFQIEKNLTDSAKLDLETARAIHDLYMDLIQDWQQDQQLLALINLLKS